MNGIEYNIKVLIKDIEVDDKYYSFKYTLSCNNKYQHGEYDSDHSRKDDKDDFIREIENGWGLELVLSQVNFNELL